jgi:hypothetical protein
VNEFHVIVSLVQALVVDQQGGPLSRGGGGGHTLSRRSTTSAINRPTITRNLSTYSRPTLCQSTSDLTKN